jgi:uncharacterized membrane protein HdeD (DUF308 family)
MRATYNFARMRKAVREIKLKIFSWSPAPGTGWNLIWRLIRLNYALLLALFTLSAITAVLYYIPTLFVRKFIQYLEVDHKRENQGWGWVYVVGMFVTSALAYSGKFFLKKDRLLRH